MRQRWARVVVVVAVLLAASAITVAVAVVSYVKAHADCGGTFGGYGGAGDDNLDRRCLEARQFDLMWIAGVVWLVALGGLWWAWRRAVRTAGDES